MNWIALLVVTVIAILATLSACQSIPQSYPQPPRQNWTMIRPHAPGWVKSRPHHRLAEPY